MSEKPKVLVCGGKDFDDRAAVYAKLDRLHRDRPFGAVIAGGSRCRHAGPLSGQRIAAFLSMSIWPIGKVSAGRLARFGISRCSSKESPTWSWHFPAARARLAWSLSPATP